MRVLADVPATSSAEIRSLMAALRAALSGAGPAVHPVTTPGPDRSLDDDPHDPLAAAVTSSGSTGEPKTVLLGASALLASAAATHDRLGGPGHWLLALPAVHVAGLQVLVRSLVSGTTPALVEPGADPKGFALAASRLPAGRRYTSLVPAQLVRLLEDDAGTRALTGFDAVLVGGSAVPAALLERARARDVRAVVTYGMSETCGGCVYDGRPLDGVRVRLDADARIWLGGPVLARGVIGGPDSFKPVDGQRWLRTEDAGHTDAEGRLVVDGRLDDVLVSGGVNVSPAAVEAVLHRIPGVREAVVVGLPDPQWGQRVAAAVVGPGLDPATLVERARAELAPAAVPRTIVVLPDLPRRGPGKPDRAAVARLLAEG